MELNKDSKSNNYIYFQKIFNMPEEKDFDVEHKKLFLIFIPHLDIPSTYIFKRSQMDWINEYRHFIIQQAKEAVKKLKNGGLFIVGGKNIRVGELIDEDGNLYEGSNEESDDDNDDNDDESESESDNDSNSNSDSDSDSDSGNESENENESGNEIDNTITNSSDEDMDLEDEEES